MPDNKPHPVASDGSLAVEQATYLLLSLTKRCNMRCPNCFLALQQEDFFQNHDIDLSLASRILADYRHQGMRQLVVDAEGEVTLHKDFPELLALISRLRPPHPPWVVTNGLQAHRHLNTLLLHTGEILVSVDGPDAESYNAFRGGNRATFDQVIGNIRQLVALKGDTGPYLIINCVISRDRLQLIPPMIELASDLGVDCIKFTNLHVTGEGAQGSPLMEDDPEVIRLLEQVVARTDYPLIVLLPALFGTRSGPFLCRMLASVVIGAEGFFSPCCRIIPEQRWGRYGEGQGDHNNRRLRRFRRKLFNATRLQQVPGICRQCSLLSPRRLAFSPQQRRWGYSRTS